VTTFADKTLSCRDCGIEFTFTAGEQEFYLTKGLTNEPGRCPECRQLRREGRADAVSLRVFDVVDGIVVRPLIADALRKARCGRRNLKRVFRR